MMKTANFTTANLMLMMQRRNVLLIIMEEVLLSKVLKIMEKLVEVGGGGYERSEYFGCHNKVFLILP